MYIQPNSIVKVLRGIDLDPDYANTIYFESTTVQRNYFEGKTKYTYNALTYQRVNKNVIRVQQKADDLYDIDYLMFQNTSYGSKWFYAFVTSVEYVNDITANIYYEIDVMQTWLKDLVLKPCFVERNHTIYDDIGDNTVPENIQTGEMVFNDYNTLTHDIDKMAIILAVCDTDSASGDLIAGVYSGAKLWAYPPTTNGISSLNTKLNSLSDKPDSVISIYMCPIFCLTDDPPINYPPSEGLVVGESDECVEHSYTLSRVAPTDTIDGYIPKNNKLFTFPYNYLHIDNASGSSLALRYELFTDQIPVLTIAGCIAQPVTLAIHAKNYKGVISADKTLNTEVLKIENYPICSWNMDAWKAWVAQNSIPEKLGKGVLSGALTGAIVSGIGATAGAIAGGVTAVTSLLGEAVRVAHQSDICRGEIRTGNINIGTNRQNFFVGRLSIRNENARIIDDYFSKYGYAIKSIQLPNISSRPQWNYIKTIDCDIGGNIPKDDKQAINNIFNKGTTFWRYGDNIGHYALDNSPTSN